MNFVKLHLYDCSPEKLIWVNMDHVSDMSLLDGGYTILSIGDKDECFLCVEETPEQILDTIRGYNLIWN